MDLGHRIRKIRTISQLSLYELGQRAGLSKGALSNIETGKAGARLETIIKIAGVFDMTVGQLLDENPKDYQVSPIEMELIKAYRAGHYVLLLKLIADEMEGN